MRHSFLDLVIHVDTVQTATLYQALTPPDRACCNDCRTFLQAIAKQALPPELVSFLSSVGIKADSPVEVWGAGDAGFLEIWWPYVGASPSKDEAEIVVEPIQGMSLRITTHYPKPNFTPLGEVGIPALQLDWEGDVVEQLEKESSR